MNVEFLLVKTEGKHDERGCRRAPFQAMYSTLGVPIETLGRDTSDNIVDLSCSRSQGNIEEMRRRYRRRDLASRTHT